MDDDNNHSGGSESSDTDSSDVEHKSSDSESDEIVDEGLIELQNHNNDSDLVNMAFKYDMKDCELRYSGDPEDDLDSFIAKFKNYAALRDYSADKKALAIVGKIKGNASTFLERIPESDKDTVDKIQTLLKDNFEGASWRWGVESKLLSRKQLPTESLDDYACDIMRWCRQVEKTDSEQMSIFVRGLLPALRGFVFSKEPKTFQDALDAARLGLAVQRTSEVDTPSSCKPVQNTCNSVEHENSTLDSVVNMVSNIVTRLDKLDDKVKLDSKKVSFADSTQNHGPTNRHRSGKRNMICYRCGRVGHVWRKCYAKYGVDGKPLN